MMDTNELIDHLRRTATGNDVLYTNMLNLTIRKAADRLSEQQKVIDDMRAAFQSLGLNLVSEAGVCSRSGQMERLEALADDAFLHARAKEHINALDK